MRKTSGKSRQKVPDMKHRVLVKPSSLTGYEESKDEEITDSEHNGFITVQ